MMSAPCVVWGIPIMTDRRVSFQPAFVLHHKPYRETSLLLEVITPQHGRTGLVVRGARGRNSRLRALLQPFRPLLLSWSGRGELHALTDAEGNGPSASLQGRTLYSGYYVNELMMCLLHRGVASAELYDSYVDVLNSLSVTGDDLAALESVLRFFELDLLAALGYGLSLEQCADDGTAVLPGVVYRYIPDHGPVSQPAGNGLAVSGDTLLALSARNLPDSQHRQEAKQLLRAMLRVHLGDKPLHSRELMRQSLLHPPKPAAIDGV